MNTGNSCRRCKNRALVSPGPISFSWLRLKHPLIIDTTLPGNGVSFYQVVNYRGGFIRKIYRYFFIAAYPVIKMKNKLVIYFVNHGDAQFRSCQCVALLLILPFHW